MEKSGHALVTAKEREFLAKLCWLLRDVGTQVLQDTFDQIHPPLVLKDHLTQTFVRKILLKLRREHVLTEKQWLQLYPTKQKTEVSSRSFGSRLLVVLIQRICHLSPPYPHGWHAQPLTMDTSLSADLVRLSALYMQIGALGGVRYEEFPVLWEEMTEVLLRLGDSITREKIAHIEMEILPQDTFNYYISQVKEEWGNIDFMEKLRHLDGAGGVLSRHRRGDISDRPGKKRGSGQDDQEVGLPPEDKVSLQKSWKLLTEGVVAEDMLDKLQQLQVIKIPDRLEIMATAKNHDRMSLLLRKLEASPNASAFKLLLDAIKFKFPAVHDKVNQIRKAVFKQGVKITVDVGSVCAKALADFYRSNYGSFLPMPWTRDKKISLREVYTPVEVVDENGKKLSLSEMFPAPSTVGPGRRVVVEALPGYGNSTLARFLAYTWATQPGYFKQNYQFVLHVDVLGGKGAGLWSLWEAALPDTTRMSSDEVWTMLENRSRDVLVLVDGFGWTFEDKDVLALVHAKKLRHATVLVFAHHHVLIGRVMKADAVWHNLGLPLPGGARRCLRHYARLAGPISHDLDARLASLVGLTIEHHQEDADDEKSDVTSKRGATPRGEETLANGGSPVENGEKAADGEKEVGASEVDTMTPEGGMWAERVREADMDWPLQDHLASPFLCMVVVVITLLSPKRAEEFGTLSALLEEFLIATAKQICDRNFLDIIGQEFPEQIVQTIRQLERMAYKATLRNKATFSEGELLTEYPDVLAMKVGALRRSLPNTKWKFICSTLSDYLAARYVADRTTDEMFHALAELRLLRSQKHAQFVSFLCAIFREDYDTGILPRLFRDMANHNRSQTRTLTRPGRSRDQEKTTRGQEMSNGKLYYYQHSLLSLAECNFRDDVSQIICDTLPQKLKIQRDGLLSPTCMAGLLHVLETPGENISQVEISLHSIHAQKPASILQLAEAIGSTPRIQQLRVLWYRVDVLGPFLCKAVPPGSGVTSVALEDHCKSAAARQASASAAAELQEFLTTMTGVKSFSFLNCKSATVVNHVIQYLPGSILDLDMTGCRMNMMCASELGKRLEQSSVTNLVLADTGMAGTELAALVRGVKLCRGLKRLSLAGCPLEAAGVAAIVDLLDFARALEVLDLARCQLNPSECTALGEAVRGSRALKQLVLTGTGLNGEGRAALEESQGSEVDVVGLVDDSSVYSLPVTTRKYHRPSMAKSVP